eukprot:scaffold142975_cov151-Phaeocystis_antarctica.AAC.2
MSQSARSLSPTAKCIIGCIAAPASPRSSSGSQRISVLSALVSAICFMKNANCAAKFTRAPPDPLTAASVAGCIAQCSAAAKLQEHQAGAVPSNHAIGGLSGSRPTPPRIRRAAAVWALPAVKVNPQPHRTPGCRPSLTDEALQTWTRARC